MSPSSPPSSAPPSSGGDPRRDVARDAVPGAGALGMRFFILSLTVLFLASLIGYLAVRFRAPEWPPAGMPRMPWTLWISTVLLITSSITLQIALSGVRRGSERALRLGMVLTTALGVAFLISQAVSWSILVRSRLTAQVNLYGFTFYVLTGLHAAHVIGGLVPLFLVTFRSFRGRYTSERHEGVSYVSVYWHFLDAVWLVLFAALVIFV
jgi:cytochrome c oxidase subunit 3